MSDWAAARDRYIQEEPQYAAFAAHVAERLREETRRRGIPCEVKGRAKEVSSFVKKALRKKYADPFEAIGDKAGVRVIVVFPDTVGEVEEIIRTTFTVQQIDNKGNALAHDRLGYRGIHFDGVGLDEGALAPGDKRFRGLLCEVQLHTRAQNLWSETEHALVYKSPQTPDVETRRAINRLVALMELFDSEVSNTRKALLGQPNFEEAAMLDQLERHFYRLTTGSFDFDRRLSVEVLGKLKSLFSDSQLRDFGQFIGEFARENEQKLREVYSRYSEDQRRNPLLYQPETLLVFERIENDAFRLKEAWEEMLPVSLLENLAYVWGRPI